jgi:hypothetical protein
VSNVKGLSEKIFSGSPFLFEQFFVDEGKIIDRLKRITAAAKQTPFFKKPNLDTVR